ncbi:MAG TPA: hypothetical protein VKP69_28195 [Isosphaeraceae bacterium]|nr:hypothetical protein [Isosphaeraceae bacterium]
MQARNALFACVAASAASRAPQLLGLLGELGRLPFDPELRGLGLLRVAHVWGETA